MNKILTTAHNGIARQYTYSLIFSAACLLILYLLFGFYYGVVDDSMYIQVMQGTFTDGIRRSDLLDNNRLLSQLLCTCYRLYPNFAWYGWMLMIFNGMALTNIIFCLRICMGSKFRIAANLLCIAAAFLLADNFVLATLTRASILLAGGSLLAFIILLYKEKGKALDLLFGLLFFIQFFLCLLFRARVTLIVFIASPLLAFYFFPGKSGISGKLKVFAWLGGLFAIFFMLCFWLQTPEKKKHDERYSIVDLLLVGQQYANPKYIYNYELDYPFDSSDVRLMALKNWFFQDENIITQKYLESLLVKSFSDLFEAHRMRVKFYTELFRAQHDYDGYSPLFNYFPRLFAVFLFEIVFIILVLAGLLSKNLERRVFITVLLFWFFFWFGMALIMVLYKMEDHFFLPYAGLHVLLLITITYEGLKSNPIRKWLVRAFIIIAVPTSAIQFLTLSGMVHFKKIEIANSISLQNYLHEQYAQKTLAFDMWSSFLFESQFFHNTPPDPSYRRISFGEDIDDHFSAYDRRLTELTGGTDILSYFRYCVQNKVTFIILETRKTLFERYLLEFYHKKFTFKAVDPANPVHNIHFNALQTPFQFGVYSIEEDN